MLWSSVFLIICLLLFLYCVTIVITIRLRLLWQLGCDCYDNHTVMSLCVDFCFLINRLYIKCFSLCCCYTVLYVLLLPFFFVPFYLISNFCFFSSLDCFLHSLSLFFLPSLNWSSSLARLKPFTPAIETLQLREWTSSVFCASLYFWFSDCFLLLFLVFLLLYFWLIFLSFVFVFSVFCFNTFLAFIFMCPIFL